MTKFPDANVFPVQLRYQLGKHLMLKLESVGTSCIALGEEGAEKLLGTPLGRLEGHLVARLIGEPALIYAQVPFLSPAQIREVVHLIRTQT